MQKNNVGADLPAIAEYQLKQALADTPPSRASPLPHLNFGGSNLEVVMHAQLWDGPYAKALDVAAQYPDPHPGKP